MLVDELIADDIHAAQEVVPGLQDGLARVVLVEVLVLFPIEVTAIALLVHVGKLEQSLLTNQAVGHIVFDLQYRVFVMDIAGGNKTGFSAGQSLEKIGPECALVSLAQRNESGTEGLDCLSHPRRKQVVRQRRFDPQVPGWVPCAVIAQLAFFSAIGVAGASLNSGWVGGGASSCACASWISGFVTGMTAALNPVMIATPATSHAILVIES